MPRNIQGTQEQRLALRKSFLAATDWISIRHKDQVDQGVPTSLTPEQMLEVLTYRQALRDWPVSGDYNESFPGKPSFI